MRARVFLALVIAVLLVPGVAHAKGPDLATIDGAGMAAPIAIAGVEGEDDDLAALVELAGLFPALFGQQPDPMLAAAPEEALGPKLVITWRLPGRRALAQLHPAGALPARGGRAARPTPRRTSPSWTATAPRVVGSGPRRPSSRGGRPSICPPAATLEGAADRGFRAGRRRIDARCRGGVVALARCRRGVRWWGCAASPPSLLGCCRAGGCGSDRPEPGSVGGGPSTR